MEVNDSVNNDVLVVSNAVCLSKGNPVQPKRLQGSNDTGEVCSEALQLNVQSKDNHFLPLDERMNTNVNAGLDISREQMILRFAGLKLQLSASTDGL